MRHSLALIQGAQLVVDHHLTVVGAGMKFHGEPLSAALAVARKQLVLSAVGD